MKPRTLLEAFENTDAAYLDAAEPKSRNSRKALFIVLAAAAVVALVLCAFGAGMLVAAKTGTAKPDENMTSEIQKGITDIKGNLIMTDITFNEKDKDAALNAANLKP